MYDQARPTKSQRQASARDKARAMREAQERQRRRRRVLGLSAGIVAVLAIVAVVAVLVSRQSSTTSSSGRPPGISAGGGIVTGTAGAAHAVVIYQDYQCPYCKQFETSANTWLEKQSDAGALTVEFRPIAFLDASSNGNEYSTRAANAAACVAGDSSVDFAAWNDAMYAQQPEEDGGGRTDSQLLAVAKKLGAGSAVGRCIVDQKYGDWVTKATSTAMSSKGGVTGTPTVLVDGKQVAGADGGIPTLAEVQTALGMSGQ